MIVLPFLRKHVNILHLHIALNVSLAFIRFGSQIGGTNFIDLLDTIPGAVDIDTQLAEVILIDIRNLLHATPQGIRFLNATGTLIHELLNLGILHAIKTGLDFSGHIPTLILGLVLQTHGFDKDGVSVTKGITKKVAINQKKPRTPHIGVGTRLSIISSCSKLLIQNRYGI